MVITNNEVFLVSIKGWFVTIVCACHDVMFCYTVPLHCPTNEFTYRSLTWLESAGIPVLTELSQKKLLNQFRTQAGFRLCPVEGSSCDRVRQHTCSWLLDNRQRELTRKPTWRNFIQVLKEIGLCMIAEEIENFFVKTTPAEDNRQHSINQKGMGFKSGLKFA